MRSKNHLLCTATLAFVAVLACGSQPPRPSVEEDTQAITAVSDARAQAFNNSDADGIAVHFTDDGLLMAPGKPATSGRQAVRAYYQSIFDEYVPELESHYEEVRVSGDLAYGRGFAKVRLTPKAGGDTVVSTSKYLNILQRQADGSWKTTHDVWNNNE
jgi:uncharacterized protein (TIGR02246 family)